MAFKMRLYHRRSSASREKMLSPNMSPDVLQKCKNINTLGCHRLSVDHQGTKPPTRSRSASLCPPVDKSNCLAVPTRSRSNSFSGISGSSSYFEQPTLTTSQEDYVFNCYVSVMYSILGIVTLAVMFFAIVSLIWWSKSGQLSGATTVQFASSEK